MSPYFFTAYCSLKCGYICSDVNGTFQIGQPYHWDLPLGLCFQLEWESVWYSQSALFFHIIIYLATVSHSQFCGPCWAYFGGQLAPTPKGTCGLINAGFSIQKFRPVIRWRVFFNRHHPFFVAYNCHVGILKMRVSKIITCPTGWKHTHYLFKNLSRYC